MKKIYLILMIFLVSMSKEGLFSQQFKATNDGLKNGKQSDHQPDRSKLSTITLVWSYLEQPIFTRMEYGASPAIIDLGAGVNNLGGEPDNYLEIVSGSDEYANFYPELNSDAYGIWRCFDALGNVEWAADTKSDEAKSSAAIADIDYDLNTEIAGGTTSGWCIEVMNKFGSWTSGASDAAWTFPYEPQRNGNFMWHSSPAIGELITGPDHEGLEVVGGNNPFMSIWAFDGDNSDGIDDGITADLSTWGFPGSTGTEGTDWDVLWVFQTGGSIIASPTIGDVEGDGLNEVVCGSKDGSLYCLNGATGALKWSFATLGMITGSAGLADFDNNGKLEIVFGSQDGNVYLIKGDLDNNGIIDPVEYTSFTTGGPVLSSPSFADINNDGQLEILIGSDDMKLFCFTYSFSTNTLSDDWFYLTGGAVQSSPSIANSGRSTLSIYFGSADSSLYILDGTGALLSSYKTNGPVITSPAVADINGDNKLEMAFTTWSAPDEFMVLRDDGSNVTAFAAPWPQFRHDARHTGLYDWAPQVLATDVGVTEIFEPNGTAVNGAMITPRVEVYNYGGNMAASFTVTFEIRNDASTVIYSSTQTVTTLPVFTGQQVSFPALTATHGHFHTKTYTTFAGDLNNDNNEEDGIYQVVQPQWVEDFEADGAGFNPAPSPNGWQWGLPGSGPFAAHSGSNLWATNLYGDYDNSTSWTLDSPEYVASQDHPVLAFWHWYDIEKYRDGGNLKISFDGVNWTLIFPVDGYPGIATWNNFGIPDQPCYNGSSGGWELTSFILPVNSGQHFTIRWHLGTDNINARPGWYIDDIMGEGFNPSAAIIANVNVKVFLEGLFNPVSNLMNKAQDEFGDRYPGTIADVIQIKLAGRAFPYSVLFTANNVDLNQDGTSSFGIPFTGTYYIVVRHRNSIETWSAAPVTILPGANLYDFSFPEGMAFGNNQTDHSNIWMIFGGDVNQDGIVDTGDMNPVENESTAFIIGYVAEDVNGDGIIDTGDMNIVENNSTAVIQVITP